MQAAQVGLNFRGSQPPMRGTIITEGCFGSNNPTLCVGDVQHMVFQSTDEGPFYLSPEEHVRRCDDHQTGQVIISKPKTKQQLIQELQSVCNIIIPRSKHMLAKEIKDIALKHGLLLTESKPQIADGWVGKPKGILQILFERGLIVDGEYKK